MINTQTELAYTICLSTYWKNIPDKAPVAVVTTFQSGFSNLRRFLPRFDLTFICPEQLHREILRDDFDGILIDSALDNLAVNQQSQVLAESYFALRPNGHMAMTATIYSNPTPPTSNYWLELMYNAGFKDSWLLEKPGKERNIAIFTAYKRPYTLRLK